MNRKKNIKEKLIPAILLFFLLGSLTSSFIVLSKYNIPNFNMFSQSYEEKLKSIPNPYFNFLIFISEEVEANSTILFIDSYPFYQIGRSFLYPNIEADIYEYDNDQDLIIYLKNNLIHYVIVILDPIYSTLNIFPLSSNATLFTINEFDSSHIILEVNRDML